MSRNSEKPRILIFTDWYKPGYKAGGPISSIINFVDWMHDHFEIYIVTTNKDYTETESYTNIDSDRWLDYDDSKVYYSSKKTMTIGEVNSLIKEVAPGTIYLNSMYSVTFALIPLWCLRNESKTKIILAPRGMLQEGAIQYKKLKKVIFFCAIRKSGVLKNVLFHATDVQERIDIKRRLNITNTFTMPNFSRRTRHLWTEKQKRPGFLKIAYISRITPKKNLLQLIHILNQLDGSPNVELHIAGPIEDLEYWTKCRQELKLLPRSIQCTFHGAIQRNQVDHMLNESHLMVLLSHGENYGHIVAESFENGCPVIISDKTPWRELEKKRVGYDINIGDNEFIISKIEEFIKMNQAEYNNWSRDAWNYAQVKGNQIDNIKQYLEAFR